LQQERGGARPYLAVTDICVLCPIQEATMARHGSLKKQREVFTNYRAFLVDYLDANDVIDELIQENMIGKNSAQRVQLQTTSREEKNRIIVDQLTNSGPGTLEKFCRILTDTGRLAFIAETLDKSWDKCKSCA